MSGPPLTKDDFTQVMNGIADRLDAEASAMPVGHTTQQWVEAMHDIANIIRDAVAQLNDR